MDHQGTFSGDGSDVFRHGIAAVSGLLNRIVPEKTTLLPNYPNPFNPETWIPYDLAHDAEVYISIYNLKGELIRQLSLGFQTAGTYRTASRAAYWDGRNVFNEPAGEWNLFLHAPGWTIQSHTPDVILQMSFSSFCPALIQANQILIRYCGIDMRNASFHHTKCAETTSKARGCITNSWNI